MKNPFNLSLFSLWTDYLEFFKQETDTHGMQKTFEDYCLHKDMFPRLFESVFHPIIHVGYGVEFQIPLIFAEGKRLYENILLKNFY